MMLPAVVVQDAMIPGMEKCDNKQSLRIYSQELLGLYLVSTDIDIDNAIISSDQTCRHRSKTKPHIIETQISDLI